MIRLLLVLLALSAPASADSARVYSGEHGEFTRLVIELPAASEWRLGRTATGYAFSAGQAAQPVYDLSQVWQRISRTRVANLDADAKTGALLLTLGCSCHVFPFEYRPGAVVLDIKPGPPPAGSAFETAFDAGTNLPDATDPVPVTALPEVYDWLSDLPLATARSPTTTLPLPLATGDVSLDPLRYALLEGIARGAADGIVDMGLPGPVDAPAAGTDALPWSSIRIGEHPGIQVSDHATALAGTAAASTCSDDDLLDLGATEDEGPTLDLLATARSGLYGEFDVADRDAVVRSVRLHLYLGFGAEAIQQANLVTDTSEDETLALYRSMARIIDGESDPDTPFAAMLDCDGNAALWAALARDRLPPGPGVNRKAILRAFLALPPHLRGHLGSGLAEKFIALDDADSARMVRDAMARTPHVDPAALALMEAENDLHRGNMDAAQDNARNAVALDGNQADALVTLVETHFLKLEPISAEVTDSLQSLQGEIGDIELSDAVARAIILSQALSGQTDAAFQHQNLDRKVIADLWRVVAHRAEDDAFLRHAVLPAGTAPPDLTADLDLIIANRLLGMGFPDAALAWLGPVLPTDPEDLRLLAAKAGLALGDARSVISLLVGLSGTEAEAVRAQALLQLGDLPAAATALMAAGQPEEAIRANLWSGDLSTLDAGAAEAWQTAAQVVQPLGTDSSDGLLGRASQAVEASTSSRAAIDALLEAVALPTVP